MTPLYVNFCNIQDSKDIVLLAFGFRVVPDQVAAVSQLMVTPGVLKQLEAAVTSAVMKHERDHGHISDGSIEIPKVKVPELN